jgi:hypothetical protein
VAHRRALSRSRHQHALVYRVEQVFLIHAEDGTAVGGEGPDAV